MKTRDTTFIVTKIWETSFVVAPYASLALCYYLLSRYKKRCQFSLVLLAFAMGTAIPMIYSANQTAESIFLFWPLLILVTCSPLKSRSERTLFSLLSLAMALSHEAGVLFFGFLACLTLYRKLFWPVAIFTLGAISSFARLKYGAYPTSDDFIRNMFLQPPLYVLPISFCAFFLLARLLRSRMKTLMLEEWVPLMASVYLLAFSKAYFEQVSIHWYLNSRGVGIPISLAMASVFIATGEDAILWNKALFKISLYFFVALALLRAALLDEKTNQDWRSGMENLQQIARQDGGGCHRISLPDFQEKLLRYGINDYHLPLLDMLIQASRKPTHILFLQDRKLYVSSPCEALQRYRIPFFQTELNVEPTLYFDIEKIRQGANADEN